MSVVEQVVLEVERRWGIGGGATVSADHDYQKKVSNSWRIGSSGFLKVLNQMVTIIRKRGDISRR